MLSSVFVHRKTVKKSAYDPVAVFQGQKNAGETESHSSVRFVDLSGDLMISTGEDSVGV